MAEQQRQPKPEIELWLLPIDIEVEGCTATLLEATKMPISGYQASVQVRCGDATSRVFQVVYRDGKELAKKLAVEVAKFKYALVVYGREELRRRGVAL